jgi:ABC-type dipeptide/oligopeptide/nickel transport system permease subunit
VNPRLLRLLSNTQVRLGAGLVGVLVVFSIVAPIVSSHDAVTSDFERGAGPFGPAGPSATFLLGADRLYRDELVRLAEGGRTSLFIGVCATALATVLGTAVGIVSGYYEGARGVRVPWLFVGGAATLVGVSVYGPLSLTERLYAHHGLAAFGVLAAFAVASFLVRAKKGPELGLDAALMRAVDVGLAFPFLLLVMALGSAFERTSATTILLTLGFSGWLGIARVVRAKTIGIKNQEFFLAARALGQRTHKILLLHVLPNVAGPVIVLATLSVAQMIVAESALSYLGVGISPPTPTWGYMLFEGQEVYASAPWLLAAPFVAILSCVLGFNVLGEGLRESLDPRKD